MITVIAIVLCFFLFGFAGMSPNPDPPLNAIPWIICAAIVADFLLGF
jgi:hypothetical protein